jgi:F0F1-type ATP synthase assembly protein I
MAGVFSTPRPVPNRRIPSLAGAGVGIGALVGWAAGSVGLGILGGAFVGIPAGVFAVYRRSRDAF